LALACALLSPAALASTKKKPAAVPAPLSVAAQPAHGMKPGRYGERKDVREWVQAQVRAGAPLAGWSEAELLALLGQAQYQPRAAQFILPAPPGQAKDWAAYRDRFVEPRRLQAGLQFWEQHAEALARAEKEYGVPAELIMGILGVETFYGQIMGNFRVLDALATLGFDFPGGRSDRTPFFREQLAEFLLLARQEGREPFSFKGSFAGAMGYGQFMPSSWRSYAVDFDGDGHIDLVGNPADAIGSVAHFLVRHGWQPGLATHVYTEPPADTAERARLLGPDIEPNWGVATLQAAGLSPALPHPGPWALVQLENGGVAPHTYVLGSRNFYAVTRYNRSAYYALAVLTLGERLGQLRKAGLEP